MLFFNESADYLTETVEDIETPFEGSSEGITDLMSEASEEWYNLRERMMRLEHTAIVSEDMELLSEGVQDFFHKIIEFFKKLWAHIKAIVTKFWNRVMQFVVTDKQFLKMYKSKYNAAKEKEIKGKDFIKAVAGGKVTKLVDSAYEMVGDVEGEFPMSGGSADDKWKEEEHWDKLRGQVVGQTSVTRTEFKKTLLEALSQDTTRDVFTPAKADVLAVLDGGKALIANLKGMRSDVDKAYSKIIKYFKTASTKVKRGKEDSDVNIRGYESSYNERGAKNGDALELGTARKNKYKDEHDVKSGGNHSVKAGGDNAAYYSQAADALKKAVAIFNATIGAGIKAINAARREARSAVIAAVNGKIDDGRPSLRESAGFSVLDQF